MTLNKKIGLGVVALLVFVGYWRLNGADNKDQNYVTMVTSKQDVRKLVAVTGSLEPVKRVQVQAPLGETLAMINVTSGDRVEAGEVLARFKTDDLEMRLLQAEAQLAQAKAAVSLQYAGATQADINLGVQEVALAEENLILAQKGFRQSASKKVENIEKAEIAVRLAETDLKRAELEYQNIQAQNEDTGMLQNQNIEQSFSGAQTAVDEAISLVKEARRTANIVLRYDPVVTETESYAGVDFGNRNRILTNQVKNQYVGLKQNLEKYLNNSYSILVVAHPDPKAYLLETEMLVLEAKLLTDQLNDVVADTIGTSVSLIAVVNDLRNNLNELETLLSNSHAKVIAARQAIDSAKLSRNTSQTNQESLSDKARLAFIAAGVKYDQAVQNLENMKLTNEDLELQAERQVVQSTEAVKRAELNLSKIKSGPRSVDLASPQAQVKLAEAQLAQAKLNLDRAEIRSPIDGYVTQVLVEEGEQVSNFQNLMAVISPELKLVANVVETDIGSVAVGQIAQVDFDAFSDIETYEARITKINPGETVIQGVIYYEVEFALEGIAQNDRIRSGLTANIDIEVATQENVVAIDPQAITYENGVAKVKVLVNGTAEDRDVETGLEGDNYIEILSGVNAGDEVVLYEAD